MTLSAADLASLVTAVGAGGIVQALIGYAKDRRRGTVEARKIDVETSLTYLNAVIVRLDEEAKRSLSERDRLATELSAEQQRSSDLRKRVRELEDEIDRVRNVARDTEHKCDQLAQRIQDLTGQP